MAPDWEFNKPNKRGQHTNTAQYIRNHPIKTDKGASTCMVCQRRFTGIYQAESAKRHLNEHADKTVKDLNVDRAKEFIVNYFMENFGVQWNAEEMDDWI